jgi:hypothetical protein
MQVTVTRHSDGSWTTGGFNSFKAGKTITYGKIEFDGKVEESQGTMGVFLTWPKSDTWPVDGEIDILETPGQDVMHTTHWEDAASGEHWYDSVRNQSYDETQWNHYELLWLPDVMTLKVNGNVVAEWTDPAAIPDVAHGIGAMGMVASNADGWMGGAPDGSTPNVTTAYMGQRGHVAVERRQGAAEPEPQPEPIRAAGDVRSRPRRCICRPARARTRWCCGSARTPTRARPSTRWPWTASRSAAPSPPPLGARPGRATRSRSGATGGRASTGSRSTSSTTSGAAPPTPTATSTWTGRPTTAKRWTAPPRR